MSKKTNLKVSIAMGSQSDYKTMKLVEKTLRKIGVSFETKIISAHRTPERLYSFAKSANKNFKVVVAGAGGAAHLPGMIASLTNLPVIGVPIETKSLKGLDSLLSVVQMPKGVVTATVAINNAMNAGLLAGEILALFDKKVEIKINKFRNSQTKSVKKRPK